MAERRESNREGGWGGLGCHEWSFVDMVMSLFCVRVCVRAHVQMFASSKGAFSFILFCFVSFDGLFPVFLSLRLRFVLTWKKFCYQMGTRSQFRVSFHRPLFFSLSLCFGLIPVAHIYLYAFLWIYLCQNFFSFLLPFLFEYFLPVCVLLCTHVTTEFIMWEIHI